ncbi:MULTISPECIES: hypothetical protein [Methylobacterium]|uniref:ATPase n=1 Tax=Methylobacterium longum TaxID=767694 RepID=A0ABT8ARC5_9HYPH|nr:MULTISPECIES: hypothetical protein [Methylobacterium]MCJ2098777.1 hypothetical protein [Methylobacterium sp. E-046]MDN3572406.1 hypothetical protein [Methylobacterium longum]GJE09453.1 hypothetical protein FOHLNKBM_0477 [Methylobacterium longum]
MPAMDEAFWATLDAQITAQRPEAEGRMPVAPVRPAPQVPALKSPPAAMPTAPSRRLASDWTSVLDTLTAAKSAAQQQEMRLREQAAEQDALLQELKRAQQETRAFEVLLRECQTQAEAKLKDVQAQAEARVRDLRAESDAQLQALEARAQAAELRAEAAEEWLRRIEQASRDLLPAAERAAA